MLREHTSPRIELIRMRSLAPLVAALAASMVAGCGGGDDGSFTLATKIGDVRDILAITDEISQYKKDWFTETTENQPGLESVESACRKALDAVVEISQSKIHAATNRGDVAAAQEDFRIIEQVCLKEAGELSLTVGVIGSAALDR